MSTELAKACEEINKRLVESFNQFTPLIQNVSNELQTTNQNLVALGNAVENEGKATRKQLLDDTNALGTQYEQGQAQTTNLIKDSTNTIVNQLTDNQTQTANLLTNGINAIGTQLESSQEELMNWEQLFQHLYEQNVRGFQHLMDGIWRSYQYFSYNNPQRAPIILKERPVESVNTSGFTPQAIEQVNRATALIDAYQNGK